MNRNLVAIIVLVAWVSFYSWARFAVPTADIMSVLYPLLSVLTLLLALARFANLRAQSLLSEQWTDGVYLVLTSLSFFLLGQVTGSAPAWNINLIRPWLVDVRGLIFLLTVVMVVFEVARVLPHIEYKE